MIISTTRMGRRAWWLGGAVAASAALAWGVFAVAHHGGDSTTGRHPASPSLHGAGWGPVAAQGDAAPVGGAASAVPALPAPMPITGAIGPVGSWHVQPFRVDARGDLVLDAATLRTLEQVHAFSEPDGVDRAAEDVAATLPEQARRQAAELARRYARYESALRQAVNPSQAPGSVDEMSAQFKAMQALRQDQFGGGAAQQLFGEQEAITARLIQLMQEDAEPQAPLEDKAARAQARLSAERMASGS
jgi:hypothetical protein